MEKQVDAYPDWLLSQKGLARGDKGRLSRLRLIREYAKHLLQQDREVTLDVIREMLTFVDRGYSLKADQIGFALAPYYRNGQVQRHTNSSAVMVDGLLYRGLRAAAKAKGVWPQTVSNRIKSEDAQWSEWHFAVLDSVLDPNQPSQANDPEGLRSP